MGSDQRPIVLSVEQALSMSYATLRCVHLGWRVIRVEATPLPGRKSKGDPNRYIGQPVAGEDRHSYYVAPNAGKEAIALDLKSEQGKAVLRRLIRELPVDVFCTNTLPARLSTLGMDWQTLREEREDLIWCGISAMGLDHPKVPGYDPVLQALCGYMDLTGVADGPPLQCGVPIIDLKAGDEAFTQIILALMERQQSGRGKQIDISMARVAVSWLHTFLPMLDMGSTPAQLQRSGNEHRQFIPVNAYPTQDGYIYLAIGSDSQWSRLVEQSMFSALSSERFATNEGRREHKAELHGRIAGLTRSHASDEVARSLVAAGIPHSPITRVEQVMELPFVAETCLHTCTPDGAQIRLPPPAVSTPFLEESGRRLGFSPAYGEQSDAVLAEAGISTEEISSLREQGVIA